MAAVGMTFFAVAFICAIAWNVLYPRLLAKLRSDHASLWHQLGCPKYVDFRPGRTAGVLRFLLKRHYLSLADDSLTILAARTRASFIGALVGMALFVVFMLGTL